jgi:hypothetical protein
MGWCSATEIFDKMAKFVLESEQPHDAKFNTLRELAVALENGDWDCQQDSVYWDDPIVQEVMRDLHPHWFEITY